MENRVQAFVSMRGKIKLHMNGYIYKKKRVKHGKYYWVCQLRRNYNYKCKSRVTTRLNDNHRHEIVSKHIQKHNHGPLYRPGRKETPQQPQTPSNNDTLPPKKDIDKNPVVYVDMPETGSEVSRSITTPGDEEPEFVQDTILYNPFEDRRIGMPKDGERSTESILSEVTAEFALQDRIDNARLPSTMNLGSASGSSSLSPASPSRQTTGVPSFMSKESQIYGSTDGADGFPLSPIPISEFPVPPPPYTEVDETPAREPPRVDEPRVVATPQPPRTQVIVNEPGGPMYPTHMPGPIIGHRNIDQKNLVCHHCGARVHTIVHKEAGGMTHLIAFLAFLIFVPLVFIVYLSDYFKYKNHYCPYCFKLIGYETPIIGQKVTYAT